VFNPEYQKWLSATPWTNRKPLPAGPAHLVFQDLFVLAVLAGVAWLRHPAVSLPHLPIKFLMAYELGLASSFIMLAMPWFAYAIVFGFGLIVLVWQLPLIALGIAAALYVVSLAGLVRSLKDFANWDLTGFEESQFLSLSQQKALDRMRQKVLGWPFDCIRPTEVAESISYRNGTMLSLLVGWWVFVALERIAPLQLPDVWRFMFGLAAMPIILWRLQIFCWGYAPPISIWGRIFTLRWIIPGYDQVFLAPIAILAVVGCGQQLVAEFPGFVPLIVPATIAMMLLCAFNLGPSLKRWRLTGNHRLSPAFLMAKKQAEVQQV
jgi:hypothetical protein